MGKIYDSLLSGSSGRTGRIVIANVNGNEISRIRPRKRTKAPSQKQLLIQQRMKMVIDFMAQYRAYACKHFGYRVGLRSCYNQAFTNVTNSFALDYSNFTITQNYNQVSFSKGNLLAAIPQTISLPSPEILQITWQNNGITTPERETDMLQILMAIEDENNTFFIENAAQRQDETYNINLSNHQLGKTLHLWIAFRSLEQDSVSNSVYLGSINT